MPVFPLFFLHHEGNAEVLQHLQRQPHIGPGYHLGTAERHTERFAAEGSGEQQPGKELAGFVDAHAHISPAKPSGGEKKRGIPLLPFKVDVRAEGGKRVCQRADGPLMHPFHAVDAELSVPCGKNGGEQATGGARFSHIAAYGT